MKTDIKKLKQDIVIQKDLGGHQLIFHTTWGLFSPKEIDEGTKMLINEVVVGKTDISLDLGCGYGALGLAIAKQSPDGRVHLVDKDYVAIEYTKKNAQLNGLNNCEIYLSNGFSSVPPIKFNTIVSNLPAKVGKELFYIFLNDAKEHLEKDGKLYVVTISGLKDYIKNNFEGVFGNYEKLEQNRHYTVAVATK